MTHTKLHSKADRGGDEESTSRSMTRRQQKYANEGNLVSLSSEPAAMLEVTEDR